MGFIGFSPGRFAPATVKRRQEQPRFMVPGKRQLKIRDRNNTGGNIVVPASYSLFGTSRPATSHNTIVLSSPLAANCLPSGEKAR